MMPAMKAVAAATIPIDAPTATLSTCFVAASRSGAPEMRFPLTSAAVPMMSGFSAMM